MKGLEILSDEYLSKKVNELSGGEYQKIMLFNTLIKDNSVVILDEPIMGLDAASSQGLKEYLITIKEDRIIELNRMYLNNHYGQLICSAGFRYPNACTKGIEYHVDRKLNRGLANQASVYTIPLHYV